MFRIKAVFSLSALLLLSACASSTDGDTYTRGQVHQAASVQVATVVSVREVNIEGTRSGIGAGAGAVIGGVAGANSHHGRSGNAVLSVLGSVAGGMLGAGAEQVATRSKGQEITIKYDDGHMIAVIQGDDERFQPGEQVRVLNGNGGVRVSH